MNDRFLIWADWRNVTWSSNNHERHVRKALENAKRWDKKILVWESVNGDWHLIEDPETYFSE
jgi:hypothetical protein